MKRAQNVRKTIFTVIGLLLGVVLFFYIFSSSMNLFSQEGNNDKDLETQKMTLELEIRLREMQLKVDRANEQLKNLNNKYSKDLQDQKDTFEKEKEKLKIELQQSMENKKPKSSLSNTIIHNPDDPKDNEILEENKNKNNNNNNYNNKNNNNNNNDNRFKNKHVIVKNVVGYNSTDDHINNHRAESVRNMFIHAYAGYEKYCMGKGELKPIKNDCDSWLSSDMGLTILDSLDTMLIMGLDDMYERGKNYVEKFLSWSKQSTKVSFFEITIRCLGGLLSAYHLTGDEFMLTSARDLADRLMPAFEGTKSGIPHAWINLNNPSDKSFSSWTGGDALLAEYGSVQLEFAYLAYLTKERKYFEKALNVYKLLIENRPEGNLYPFFFHPEETSTRGYHGDFGIGAWGDSFYEYVLKYWILTGQKDDIIKNWYLDISGAAIKHLSHPLDEETIYLANKYSTSKTDHLSCFAGGMFALGAATIPSIEKEHKHVGKGVSKFCHDTYITNPTGLPCDTYDVRQDYKSKNTTLYCTSNEYKMRPEAVESWFYLYRTTGDKKYQEWGWQFFQSIEKHTKTPSGYGGLRDASKLKSGIVDRQESFFLAETLKYLYLLFSPKDVVPLDKFVFTTEAHIFPIIENFPFKMKVKN